MNPSASGWIPKFITLFPKENLVHNYSDSQNVYKALKSTGFLYGFSVDSLAVIPSNSLKFTTDEYTKINLFYVLLHTFFVHNPDSDYKDAIYSIVSFYKQFEKGKTSFFHKLTFSKSKSDTLEQIFMARLQESNSVIEKNTATVLTFALLYIDVLSYTKYLTTDKPNVASIKQEAEVYENVLIDSCFLALHSKQNKTKSDTQLIALFNSSKEFILQRHFKDLSQMKTHFSVYSYFEKRYILDLCTLSVWEDNILDKSELEFLNSLCKTLELPIELVLKSINDIKQFSKKNGTKIKLFQYSHPINQLYKNAYDTVRLLIIRNSKRLTKELVESKELLVLLGQSTLRNLDEDEKKKVKEQLLDICKTVPSLTIFLVPGGSLLLPILVKLIPALLPSAFNENKIEKKN